MIELTEQQVQSLENTEATPPRVMNPRTKETFVLLRVEEYERLQEEEHRQTPVEPWKHLVARTHPWRKQLFLKGRNMTVRQLVGTVKANLLSEEEAAEDLSLPVEAIREAFAYFDANPEVIELDAAYERYLRKLRGVGRGPQPVPR